MENTNSNDMINDLIILHEDNHILVVLKPQNIPTQADSSEDIDMLNIVKNYIKVSKEKPGDVYVGLVHRLDRPTGGVMVFAKTSKAAARLSLAIREGNVDKKYLAVLCGSPRYKTGKLTHYISKDERTNIVTIVPMSVDGAKFAELDYKVLEEKQGYSLVGINLITGRSHQARVQMASMGTPIFGDKKYGANEKSSKYNLALWAYELKFPHPITQEMMVFRAHPEMTATPWRGFDIPKYLDINKIHDVVYDSRD